MTRWIKNLDFYLSEYTSDDVKRKILEGCEQIGSQTQGKKKAEWANQVIEKLEALVDETERIEILEDCGRRCIGQSTLQKAKALRKNCESLDAFIEGLNQSHIGGGKITRSGNILYASYARCYCGMVSQTRQPMSATYCNCSRGWYLALFEQSLCTPVRVELIESIIQGDDICKFEIELPQDFTWK